MCGSVRSDRVWALLAYLAVHAPQWCDRTDVAAALWPGVESDSARHRLRQTLLYVKAGIGSAVESDRKRLRLANHVRTDIVPGQKYAAFLDGLTDEWLEEFRLRSTYAMLDADEEPDGDHSDWEHLSVSELEAYLLGQLPLWLRAGRLRDPIRRLARYPSRSDVTRLALAELHLTLGEIKPAETELSLVRSRPDLLAWQKYLEGTALHRSGDHKRAAACYRESIRLAKDAPQWALQAMIFLGYTGEVQSDPDRLERLAAEGLRRAEEAGDAVRREMFELLAVLLLALRGDKAAALRRLSHLERFFWPMTMPGVSASQLLRVGRLYEHFGELDKADRTYDRALRQTLLTDNGRLQAEAFSFIGDRHLAEGRYAESMAQHTEAAAIRRQSESPWGLATSLRGIACSSLRMNLLQQTWSVIRESVRIYEQLNDRTGTASVLFLAAQAAGRGGHAERARRCIAAALDLVGDIDEARYALDIPPVYGTLAEMKAFSVS